MLFYLNMSDNSNDYLYEENILEHFRNPRNKIERKNVIYNVCGTGENIDCGDNGEIYLNIDDNGFISVSWSGSGCALSQASLSMLSQKINDDRFKIQDLRLWSPAVIYDLLGVKISQGRVNCALLSYKCLENALKKIK